MKVTVIGTGGIGQLVAQVLRTTGCALTVIGQDEKQLEFCEKKGIQGIVMSELAARQDRDAVILCEGGPSRFGLAALLVRPRGTIVLTSQCSAQIPVDCVDPACPERSAAPHDPPRSDVERRCAFDPALIVANELTVVGSRSGPFARAIDALAGGLVDVRSVPTRIYDFDDATAAIDHARTHRQTKTLLSLVK